MRCVGLFCRRDALVDSDMCDFCLGAVMEYMIEKTEAEITEREKAEYKCPVCTAREKAENESVG